MDTELTPPVPRLSTPLTPDQVRQLRRLTDKAKAATADRDQYIYERYVAGGSLRAIAEATGLSHAGIRKIVQRLESAGDGADT